MEFKTQEEYLLALAEALKYMNPKDATKVLQYYQTRITNAIEYGEKEADVIRNLPDIETVAKETYESHGVNYLEMRKKLLKRRQIFNNIIGIILSFFILIGFFVIMYFLVQSIANMFGLMFNAFKTGSGVDKYITPVAVLLYILCIVLLVVYVVDLFIILLSNFLGPIIKLKDETKHRKIFTFTITGFIEEKCKHQKVQIKLLVSFIVLLLICVGVSYSTNGYFKNSLNDTPSKSTTYTVGEDITTINVNGYNGNIYFKKAEDDKFIVEHQYEFVHNLDLTISNNKLNINLEMTKAYDVLNLLTEPTQNLIFYIPETYSNLDVFIDMDESIVDISDTSSIASANIKIESKGTCSVVNSYLSLLQVYGYEMNFAAANSIILNLELESSKGQTLIQQESLVRASTITNGSGYVKLENSNIVVLILNNKSGTIECSEIKGNYINLTSKMSVNTFKDIYYSNVIMDISSSCQLTISNSITSALKVKSNSSHVLLDYVQGEINLDSTSGHLYLSGVGSKIESASDNYNNYEGTTTLTINNTGSSCKTEIADCTFNKLSITQDGGFIDFKNSTLSDGMINAANCETIDLVDLSGSTCNLYISNVKETMVIDAKEKTGLKYVIKVIDTLSYARMLADEEVVDVVNEAAQSNE